MYTPKRNECMCALKDMYRNVHGIFRHKSQKLYATHMSTNGRMDQLQYTYLMEYHRVIKKSKLLLLLHATTYMNFTDIMI